MSAEASLEGAGIDVRSEYSCSVHGPKGLKSCMGPTVYCIRKERNTKYQTLCLLCDCIKILQIIPIK